MKNSGKLLFLSSILGGVFLVSSCSAVPKKRRTYRSNGRLWLPVSGPVRILLWYVI